MRRLWGSWARVSTVRCFPCRPYAIECSSPPPPCVTRPCRNLPPCSSLGQVLLWRCGCSLPRGSLWQRDSADVHGLHRAVPRGLLLRPGIGVSHPSAVLGGRSVLLCRGTCMCPVGLWCINRCAATGVVCLHVQSHSPLLARVRAGQLGCLDQWPFTGRFFPRCRNKGLSQWARACVFHVCRGDALRYKSPSAPTPCLASQ